MNWGTTFLTFIRIAIISFFYFLHSPVQARYESEELRSVEKLEEKKIRSLNHQELHELEIALKRRLPIHRRADMYFRLAELYFDSYRLEFLLEGRVHEKKIASGVSDKFIDRYHSKIYLNLGIQACLDILKFRISFKKMADIYYLLGFYYSEKEDQKTSAMYYLKLFNQYPNHPLSGLALKELGNYFFKKSDFHQSLFYFKKALHLLEEKELAYINHKIAWCLYKIKKYEEAISGMKQVIEECFQKNELEALKQEALRDITLFLVERKSSKDAIDYFRSVISNPASLAKELDQLADQYLRVAKKEDAIAVYQFISQGNYGDRLALLNLIKIEIEKGNHDFVFQKIKERSFHHQSADDLDDEEKLIYHEEKSIKALIRKTAVKYHTLYRKKKQKESLKIAESYYSFYLYFSGNTKEDTLEVQMYLAEVKTLLGKNEEAILIYRQIANEKKESSFVKKAQLLWLATLTDAIKKQKAGQKLSALERQFIELTDLWMRIPSKKLGDVQELAIKSIRLLAGYPNSKKEALPRIREFIKVWPDSSYALTAAKLWIQLYQEAPETIEDPASEIAGNSILLESDRKKNQGKIQLWIDSVKRKKDVLTIKNYEKSGNTLQAALSYESFAKTEKDQNIREKAYQSACEGYLKNNRLDLAMKLMKSWNIKSSKKKESLKMLASWAFVHGEFIISSELFYDLGTVYRDPEALETAARLKQGMNESVEATVLWNKYIELYPKSPRYLQVVLSLARSEEALQQDSQASKHYQLCAHGDFTAECKSHLADLYFKNKDFLKARMFYEFVAKMKSSSFYVAYARFKLAQMKEASMTFEPLALPEKHLQKVLSERLHALEILSGEYEKVIQAGGPWSIGALHHLASFVMKCANELDSIQAPSHLKPESAKKFKSDLKTLSDSLKKKAQSAWLEAYNKSIQNDLYSPFMPIIADYLADFRNITSGQSFPFRAQGPRNQLILAGMPIQGDESGLEASFKKVREAIFSDKTHEAQAWIDYGNLLWGEKKPLIAKIAYERALQVHSNHPGAWNNLAILQILTEEEENWIAINESHYLLKKALNADDFFIEAKMNLATLMNYYKNFSKAHVFWEQVLTKKNTQKVLEGLAISLEGLGNLEEARSMFEKAKKAEGTLSPFVIPYHQAAEFSIQGSEGAKKCLSLLKEIDFSKIYGFERSSVQYLKERCEQWKDGV